MRLFFSQSGRPPLGLRDLGGPTYFSCSAHVKPQMRLRDREPKERGATSIYQRDITADLHILRNARLLEGRIAQGDLIRYTMIPWLKVRWALYEQQR